ncbi:hypothetical protein GGR52DRAFT_206525 [Hypoxylon sp. FL1284]|nr:hypothetical protein GGR52DRAFT_206525 [Hypoxylon sp. FL1284]
MAPLCKFWQQGYCRNGASCRFEHPNPNPNANSFASNTNRFSALNSGNKNNYNSNNNYRAQDNTYSVTKDGIKSDLTIERPQWILSCYGPGRDSPAQLFGGYPREQSLEEIMLYIRGSGNEQQAMSEVTGLYQQAEQQIQTTLNNLDGAMQFLTAAGNEHPNRIEVCKQSNAQTGATGIFARGANTQTGFPNPLTSNPNPFSSAPQQRQNPFAAGGGNGTPSFGQPSAMGQKPNPFGPPPSSTAFGQPSALGPPKPAFGQPSHMGAAPSPFGQQSSMGAAGPAFGQTSALGQKPNPFSSAAPSAPTPTAFGQPSALGQRPNPFSAAASSGPSPFSQATPSAPSAPSVPSAPNPFGKPAAANPFAQGASASADQPMATSAPAAPAPVNPFGKPASNPFAAQTNGTFGGQIACGVSAAANNPFAQPQAAAPTAKNNPYAPDSSKQHPPPESYIIKTMNGRVTQFNGQPVFYKWKVEDKYQDTLPPDYTNTEPPAPGIRKTDGTWCKIFFPDGPPAYNKDTEPDRAQYTADIKAVYETMTAIGKFPGPMPEVPPLREDCVWNF